MRDNLFRNEKIAWLVQSVHDEADETDGNAWSLVKLVSYEVEEFVGEFSEKVGLPRKFPFRLAKSGLFRRVAHVDLRRGRVVHRHISPLSIEKDR